MAIVLYWYCAVPASYGFFFRFEISLFVSLKV
jgi:hypothetical protein